MKSTASFAGARWTNDDCRQPNDFDRNIALIGCGNFAFSNIAYYLHKLNPKFLRAAFDIQASRSLSLCNLYRGAYAVDNWREILADPQVKTVFIASNHASYAEYAVAAIDAGKHVHIEKPHVVSEGQLKLLTEAIRRHPEVKVFLGFNRPRSYLFCRLQDFLKQESGCRR